MHGNANAAHSVVGASTLPRSAARNQARALASILPERKARSEGRVSTSDVPLGRNEIRQPLLSPGACVAGKYVICDVLGTGGSAIVYAAEQIGLKRVVAFKLYPVGGALAPKLLERFEREAQLLARVHHENVVAVFDAGSMPDGSPYLVVQRLQGESLATRLLKGPLPVEEAVDLTHQVLNALSALSDAGIAHRDVKPGNLVFDRLPDGRTVLKLVDFGVAKETHSESSRVLDEMVGTPYYMAPEQVRGEEIDARCDLYALAATLYEMLGGRPPHTGETLHDIAMATLFGPITPLRALRPDCPEALEQIVMRGLARDPSDRFASAREMKRALDRWQTAEEARALVATAREHDTASEITLRIYAQDDSPFPARGRPRKRRTLAIACLAALGSLALSQELHIRSHTKEASGHVAAQALQASAPSPLDLALQAGSLASALVEQTSASAAELLSHARTSAHELLKVVRHSAPDWSAEGGKPARGR